MRVTDTVKKTIVFVGVAHETGFEPYGTGFVVTSKIREHAFQSVVTAKHVVDTIKSHGKNVSLRVNTRDGGAMVLLTRNEGWQDHPDARIDISVCPTVIPLDRFDIMYIPVDSPIILTEQVIKDRDIGIGTDVYIAGMYIQRIGEAKNIPIVRMGTIAAMPEEKISTAYGYHDAYLIELQSLGGLSGSPVFVTIPPVTHRNGQVRFESGFVEYFAGVLLGHNNLQDQRDAVEMKNPNKKKDTDPDSIIAQVPLNTGIGVVLPIAHVIEAVEQPIMQKNREESLKRKGKNSSFVADAGPKQKTDIRSEAG